MQMIAAVATGGAIGAVLRYLLALQITAWSGPSFPAGVLVINVTGCFVMGVLAQLVTQGWSVTPEFRTFLMTGILGGFTTFSAFALDAAVLAERGDVRGALVYVLASVAGSIMSLFLGLYLVRISAS
jgi:CrcB protein